jgi:hypothetical protein
MLIYILFLTAIKLKCPPPFHEWGGGGLCIQERERKAIHYIPFYTIPFKVPSAAPGIRLKGAFHERCYVHILSKYRGAWRRIYSSE